MVSFKRKRKLTKPLLKLVIDKEFFLKIVSPVVIEEKKGKTELGDDGKPKKEVFHLMDVVNLETGEDMKILVNSVLEDILKENYPEDKYVGMGFAITKYAKATGRKYHTYNVEEIELPEEKSKESAKPVSAVKSATAKTG